MLYNPIWNENRFQIGFLKMKCPAKTWFAPTQLYLWWNSLDIGMVVRVFAISPGDLASIPDRVIPKTRKMVLDLSLLNTQHYKVCNNGGARSVMVIVVGNEHDDVSSKSWTRLIAFHIALIPLGKVWIQLFSLQLWVGQTDFFSLGATNNLGEGKLWIQTC